MSAMHAGVMTTSTEMMYAQHVTLTVGVLYYILPPHGLPAFGYSSFACCGRQSTASTAQQSTIIPVKRSKESTCQTERDPASK